MPYKNRNVSLNIKQNNENPKIISRPLSPVICSSITGSGSLLVEFFHGKLLDMRRWSFVGRFRNQLFNFFEPESTGQLKRIRKQCLRISDKGKRFTCLCFLSTSHIHSPVVSCTRGSSVVKKMAITLGFNKSLINKWINAKCYREESEENFKINTLDINNKHCKLL